MVERAMDFNSNLDADTQNRRIGRLIAKVIATSRYNRYRNLVDMEVAKKQLSTYIPQGSLAEFVTEIQNHPRNCNSAVRSLLHYLN